MKKFKVTNQCNACGMCTTMTDLLQEDKSGKAVMNEGKYITDDFIETANKIVSICPVAAISIMETSTVKSTGKQGIKELEQLLDRKLKQIKQVSVGKDQVKFDSNKYSIDYGSIRGEYDYRYSSDSQAERAGLNEFDRVAYSQYRPFILNVFVQYKNDKLKPFYSLDEKSFYAVNNKKYEAILKEIATEVEALTQGQVTMPKEFTRFSVFPGGNDRSQQENLLYGLQHFDEQSVQSGVMEEYKSSSYSSLESYRMYIDTDDREVYEGEDWRGREKYTDKYCYKSVTDAVRSFISDLKSAMNYVDIDESAMYFLNGAINSYNQQVEKEISIKLKMFNDIVSKYR